MATKKTPVVANKAAADQLRNAITHNSPDVSAVLGATPIGVPAGYTAVGPKAVTSHTSNGYFDTIQSAPTAIPPQYMEGAEYKYASAPPEQIQAMQTYLVKAGLLTDGFHYGAWDAATAAAYKQVLALANRMGTDDNAAMQQLLDNPLIAKAGSGSSRAPLVKHFTRDADIQQVADAVAPTVIGRKLTGAETASIIAGFHALQDKAETTDYNANDTAGTSYSEVPNVSDYVTQQARVIAPVDAGVVDRETAAQTFFKAIQGTPASTATF